MFEFKLEKDEIKNLLENDDNFIKNFLSSITHPSDIVEIFRLTEIENWPKLLSLIDDPEKKAHVFFRLDKEEWQLLFPLLSVLEIANIIKELQTDDAADLLVEVPIEQRLLVLRLLTREERLQVQDLLRYPNDSAGGIMQLELAVIKESQNVEDAIKIVRDLVEEDTEVLSMWVVDEQNRLVGVVALVDLLLNKSTKNINEIMNTDIISVHPLVDQEQVAIMFQKYDLITLPVVDEQNRLLGRIVVDDVVDVLTEEAEEDALHMAGISSEELLYKGSVFSTAKVRLPWLGLALGCSLISAMLLHVFEPLLQKLVVIFAFVPVITAMSGNVGTQSATVLIRGFATGKFDLWNVPRILFKEVRVGILMGIIYGIFAGLTAIYILSENNYYFGVVVFLAMVSSMMMASILGVLAPSLLKKLNVDPAISSGPFVTTFNDITGILIYMLICSVFLSYIKIG